MRKRIINSTTPEQQDTSDQHWLELEPLVDVEITSEDEAYPVESALVPGSASGWRAAQPGAQTLRLVFHTPQSISTILLSFEEPGIERTQEYVLRWTNEAGESREIVRQQWNFSPAGATIENETWHVELAELKTLELNIIPNISGGDCVASLKALRIA